jgi:hypothetical protein
MKHRYIVRTYVEAKSPQEALKLAKGITPHEVYLDDRVWEKMGYQLTEVDRKQLGFKG